MAPAAYFLHSQLASAVRCCGLTALAPSLAGSPLPSPTRPSPLHPCRDSGARSDPISLDSLPWQKQAKEGLDGLVKGWSRKGTVQLPPGLRNPGAVLVTKEQPEGAKGPALDYLSTLSLKRWARLCWGE